MKFNKFVIFIVLILVSLLYSTNLVRVNSNDDTWTRTWTSGYDSGMDLVMDPQGNIYVVGYIYRSTEISDICLLKYDKTGIMTWNRVWNQEGKGISITLDSSGNIYIAGNKNEDALLMKCSDQGDLIWNRTWGGLSREVCHGILVDSLNNSYIMGSSINSGINGFIVKYNSSGHQLWEFTRGTSEFRDFSIDNLDNIYIAGRSQHNAILIKLNSSGKELWNATVDYNSMTQSVKLDSKNNIIYATESLLQKFNNSGNIIWIRSLPDVDFLGDLTINNNDNIYVLENRETRCPPDNLYFGGISQCICTAIYLEKFNSAGNLEWEIRCTGCVSAAGQGILLDSSNNIYICGTLHSTIGCSNIQDILLIKNPINCTGVCNEIYYDLIAIGIGVPGALLIVIDVIIIKRIRAKRKES